MALRDGVLLQSERFWAAAVRSPDGGVHVTSGEKPRIPARDSFAARPVLRGLLRLGESLAVLPAVRRSTGGPVLPQEDPRLLAATAASAVATLALRTLASRVAAPQGGRRRRRLAGSRPAPAARLATCALPRRRAQERGGLRERPRSGGGGEGARALRLQPHRAAGRHHGRQQSRAPRAAGKERQPVATLRRRTREHRHGHGAVLVDGAPPGSSVCRARCGAPASRCSGCSRRASRRRSNWTWRISRSRSC